MKKLEHMFYSIYPSDSMIRISGKDTDAVLRWYADNRSVNGGLRDPNAKPIPLRIRRKFGALPSILDVDIYSRRVWLISEQFAAILKPFLTVQPIRIPVSGYPKLTTDQWCAIVDVTTVLDAANLQASEAYIWDNNPESSPERLSRKRFALLDPVRVSAGVEVFCIRRFDHLVYSSAIKRALKRAGVPDLKFRKHAFLEEPEASRQEYLKKLEHDTLLLREKIRKDEAEGKPSRPEPDAACITGWATIKQALGRNVGKEFENHNIFDEDDFLEHNTLLRHDQELAWPSDYWAIAEDGRGGYWTLRVDSDGTAGGEVWYYDHELATPGRKGGKATPNFESCAANLKAWVALLKKGEDGL
jgi:hypothetical protein